MYYNLERICITNQKRNIKWVIIGIVILLLNEVIIDKGFYIDPKINSEGVVEIQHSSINIITEISGLTGYILSFFAVGAIAAIVYGGFLVLTASFNEEQADKGKSIIKNVGIGVVLAIISYSIIRTVIFF